MKKMTIALLSCILLAAFQGESSAQTSVTRIAYDQCLGSAGMWDLYCSVAVVVDGHDTVVAPGIDPKWSPDSSKIVFTGSSDPNDQFFWAWSSLAAVRVMNVADGSIVTLTDSTANNFGPVWSRDGSKIAFVSQRDWSNEIYVMDANGANQMRVTQDAGFTGVFAWSPDNARFAFASNRDGATELYVINADGSNLTRVTNNMGATGAFTWSHDGTRIAFDCVIGGNADICTINSDGTGFVRLTNDAVKDSAASFSSVDDRIAFVTERFGAASTAIIDADGVITQVAPGTGGGQPRWSPDGNRLALITTAPSFNSGSCYTDSAHNADDFCIPVYGIDIVNADGTGLTQIASGDGVDWFRSQPGQPIAALTYSCNATTCDFDAAGSFDSDGTIANYVWQFGDGTTASGSTAHHDYAIGNQYGVSLTVTDDSGASGVARIGVTANTAPIASFTFNCDGPTCTFDGNGSSDPDGTIVKYEWFFGDNNWGGTATTAQHTYRTGTYSASLVVTDNGGMTNTMVATVSVVNQPSVASFTSTCSGSTCTFDASASYDPDGMIFGYWWTFADGTSTNGKIVTHTFAAGATYTVTLSVNDSFGGASQSQNITIAGVNKPPAASFTFACDTVMCDFNASASSDPDGIIANYLFDFGDGKTWSGAGYGPYHQYSADGTYTVTLTVTDNGGLTAQTSRLVTVAFNKPPIAAFTQACSGLTCSFNASASSDPDGTITSYGWNFGDGSTGNGVTTNRTYASGGTYAVTLTVIDNKGAVITQTQSVTVTSPSIHAGDLDGAASTQQNTWTATTMITIHADNHQPLASAVVSVKWNDGSTSSCTTNAGGQCAAAKSGISKKTASVTMTITNVARAAYVYKPADNHDPDGDSNGVAIAVIKP